jgi:hypothetical protein
VSAAVRLRLSPLNTREQHCNLHIVNKQSKETPHVLLTSVSAAVRLRLSPPQGQGDHSNKPNLML